MVPKFTEEFGGYILLKCPSCQGNNVCHTAIEIFDREEDKDGLHVVVDKAGVRTDTNMKGNPSTRRHGLRIVFSCETCPALTALTIAQHKGETEVRSELLDPTAGWSTG